MIFCIMCPTFCLVCLTICCYLEFYFQVSGHRFKGVSLFFKSLDTGLDFSGSSVELLANCSRRQGGGKAEGKWIINRRKQVVAVKSYNNQFTKRFKKSPKYLGYLLNNLAKKPKMLSHRGTIRHRYHSPPLCFPLKNASFAMMQS